MEQEKINLEFTVTRGLFSMGFGCALGALSEPGNVQEAAMRAASYGLFWGGTGYVLNRIIPTAINRTWDYALKDGASFAAGVTIGQGLRSAFM